MSTATVSVTKDALSPAQINYKSGGAFEEILNGLTHALGAGMSIAGLAILLVLSRANPDPWRTVSFAVYGTTQIVLYLSSALLHGFAPYPRLRAFFSRLDHSAVYLLIAGTYTPLALTLLRGPWGWSLFGIVWGLSLFGLVMKMWVLKKPSLIIDGLYLPLGWMVVMVIRPLFRVAPAGFMVWLLIGGLSYSIGFIFYALKGVRFAHVIWHLFVIGGSISFFLGYAMYLI